MVRSEPGAGETHCDKVQPQRAETQHASFTIRLSTPEDIDALTELHWACFQPDDHLPVILGKPYIRAMYRWQVSGKEAYMVVAESGGELIGFAGACDGPYRWLMLKACQGQLVISLVRNPLVLLNGRLWRHLFASREALDREARRTLSRPGVAHLTTGAVDARFRGKGIIRALVETLQAISRSRGSTALCVGVYRTNRAIRSAFARLSWTEVPVSETSELVYYITCLDSESECPD